MQAVSGRRAGALARFMHSLRLEARRLLPGLTGIILSEACQMDTKYTASPVGTSQPASRHQPASPHQPASSHAWSDSRRSGPRGARGDRRALAAALVGLGLILVSTATPAGAAETAQVNVRRMRVAPHSGDLLSIRTAADFGGRTWAAGLFLGYAGRPLVIVDGTGGAQDVYDLVNSHYTVDLQASYVIFERLSIAANLPLVAYSAGGRGFPGADPAAGFALGEARVSAKWLIIARKGSGFGLAVEPELTLPTAGARSWAGDTGLTFAPRLIADLRFGATTVAANAAIRLRGGEQIGFYEASSEIEVGAGLRHDLLDGRLKLIGEAGLSTQAGSPFDGNGTALELQGGAALCVTNGLSVYAVAGGGALEGLGSTSLRAMVGVRAERCWDEPVVLDGDRDGVPDGKDACPAVAGVADPDPARNGCPPDGDRDGIVDAQDACPQVAGAANADPARNGCPPDRDGDGIVDDDDACPKVAGMAHAEPARNGCPPDRDNDGVADAQDACPDVPGRPSADPAENGCPPDTDGDGIRDHLDACPETPGDASEFAKKNGCPPPEVMETKIELTQRIEFDVDEAIVLPAWKPVLDDVVQLMKDHSELVLVRLEGHTDNTHTADHNRSLSLRRARAVVAYMVSRGVARKRLDAAGYGDTRPKVGNDTEEGRQRNRRVEFTIVTRSR